MKKNFAAIAVMAILTIGLFCSCATKEHAINRLEKFSYELRDHSAYYTMDEWKKAAEKFARTSRSMSLSTRPSRKRRSACSKANAPAIWPKALRRVSSTNSRASAMKSTAFCKES